MILIKKHSLNGTQAEAFVKAMIKTQSRNMNEVEELMFNLANSV